MSARDTIKVFITGDASGFKKAAADVEASAGKMGTSVSTKLAGLAAGIGFGGVVAGIKKSVDAYTTGVKAARDFATMSGLSMEQASKWNEVAGDLGVNADVVSGAFFKLNKNLGAGTAKAASDAVKAQNQLKKQTIDVAVAQQKYNDAVGLKDVSGQQKAVTGLANAQNQLKKQTIDVATAQMKYNDAVGKKGANSPQAQKAMLDLASAQNDLKKQTVDLTSAQQKSTTVAKAAGANSPKAQKALVDLQAAQNKVKETQLKLTLTTKSAGDQVSAFGVQITKTKNGVTDSNQVFLDALKRIRDIQDPVQKDAIAMKLFGRSAAELAPLIANLDTLQSRIAGVSTAQTFTEADNKKVQNFSDSVENLKDHFQAFEDNLGRGLVPVLASVFTWLSNLNPTFITVGVSVLGLSIVVGKLSGAFQLLGGAFSIVAANPMLIALAAVSLALVELIQHAKEAQAALGGIFYGPAKFIINHLGGNLGQGTTSLGPAGIAYAQSLAGQASIAKRAMGGTVTAGTPYVVGERGPEMFWPGQNGYVQPHGGQTVIQYVTVQASNSFELNRQLALEAQQVKRARG